MDAHGIEYSTDGITVVRGVLTPAQVETLRSTIYDYVAGGGDHVRTHAFGDHGGWYVGGVHHIEELTHAVQQLHASARLHRALSKLMGGSRSYRMLSRNEVYIDRYGTWHADTVIGKYIAYQAPDARGADGQKCREPLGCLWTKLSNGETYNVATVALYLEDHVNSSQALHAKPRTHVNAREQLKGMSHRNAYGREGVSLHPRLGDAVVFDTRMIHRGQDLRHANMDPNRKFQPEKQHRGLLSLTYGRNNGFSDSHDRCFSMRTRLVGNLTLCGGAWDGPCAMAAIRHDLHTNPL